ncbi:putative glycosyltransferase YibD [Streptococcus pneumoniae]|nr:putative glycosyltransferase YibD [Streptococcus pneumoniae]CVZ28860.1 putative glycosyltransferase YibD [Streptococcus pneumoniae]
MDDKITVIVPVYNVENYLRKCLDSIITQTYKNIEIVVVNDGSTDASGEICKEFAEMDHRITYIEQENAGLSAARNTGLNNMSGNYVTLWIQMIGLS